MISKRKLEFASHPANLSMVRNFVRQFLETLSFSETEINLMILGIDEACTNIIRHAYDLEECQPITLSCECINGKRAVFKLRDYGRQKDPEIVHARPLEIIQPGGLGLHLIRKAFDAVDYNIKRQGTELVLIKERAGSFAD